MSESIKMGILMRVMYDGTGVIVNFMRCLKCLSELSPKTDPVYERYVHELLEVSGKRDELDEEFAISREIREIRSVWNASKFRIRFRGFIRAKDFETAYAELRSCAAELYEELTEGKKTNCVLNETDITCEYTECLWETSLYFAERIDGTETELRDTVFEEWREVLLDPEEGVYEDPHLLISASREFVRMLEDKYPIISCSYLSKDVRGIYEDRKFGWVFYPKAEEIIGMSPNDLYCGARQVKSPEDSICLAFKGAFFVDTETYVKMQMSDFLPGYRLNKMRLETKRFNEVLLRGTAKPVGIFVVKKYLNEVLGKVVALAEIKRLPIVIYDTETGAVEVKRLNCDLWSELQDKNWFV